MVAAFIQEIIQQFSLRTLYLEMAWFATIGYVMHVFVVMALTRLPFMTLMQAIVRLHMTVILASFAIAPVLAALHIVIFQMLSLDSMTMWFAGQQVYIWFTMCMMVISSYLLCQVFATVPCQRFRLALFVTNASVGALGLFVFKALDLLRMI